MISIIKIVVLALIFYSPLSSRDFDISDIPVQDEGVCRMTGISSFP